MNHHRLSTDAPLSDPLVTPRAIVLDLILVGIFFYYMFGVIQGHVPFEEERLKAYAAAYATTCVSGVFWLALQCLRVTWKDHKRRNWRP